jgi:hypothetical protein
VPLLPLTTLPSFLALKTTAQKLSELDFTSLSSARLLHCPSPSNTCLQAHRRHHWHEFLLRHPVMKTNLQPHLLPPVRPFHPPPSSAQGGPRAPSHLKSSEAAGSDLGVAPHTCGASLCAPGSMHSSTCEGAPIHGNGAAGQSEAAGSDLGVAAQARGASLCTPGSRCLPFARTCPSFEPEGPTELIPPTHRAHGVHPYQRRVCHTN